MSRIDQALKIWEGANGAHPPEADSAPHGGVSQLRQFPREGLDESRAEKPRASEPHASELDANEPGPPPLSEPPAPAPRRTPARSMKSPDTPYLQARLVTGGLNNVSVEQYRRLAAVLHEEQVQRQLKTVMITSALPEEGKTLTLVNLALTLSESYARQVLVIDADLRRPSLHTVLDVPNDRGLSETLREGAEALPIYAVSSHLSVLPAGHPGESPFAGLTSARMGEVIDECAARFDWVLVDTAPVGVLPDAQVLARLVGAVIFVIGAGTTPADTVERAIAELGPDSVLGTVLNSVDEYRIPEAGYYGRYGYSGAGRRHDRRTHVSRTAE